MQSSNNLSCLCSAVLSLHHIWAWWKSAWGSGPVHVSLLQKRLQSRWRIQYFFLLIRWLVANSLQRYQFWSDELSAGLSPIPSQSCMPPCSVLTPRATPPPHNCAPYPPHCSSCVSYPTMFPWSQGDHSSPTACRPLNLKACPASCEHQWTGTSERLSVMLACCDWSCKDLSQHKTHQLSNLWGHVLQCVSALMEMRRQEAVETMNAGCCCLLLRSSVPSRYSLFLAIEIDLLPRESEMIGAVLRNVVKVERGQCFLTPGWGECQVKECEV